jgi:hypothetical protein
MHHTWSGGGSGGGLKGGVEAVGPTSSDPWSFFGGGFRGGLCDGATKVGGAQMPTSSPPSRHLSSIALSCTRKTASLTFSGPFGQRLTQNPCALFPGTPQTAWLRCANVGKWLYCWSMVGVGYAMLGQRRANVTLSSFSIVPNDVGILTLAQRWSNVNQHILAIFFNEDGILTLAQRWYNVNRLLFALFSKEVGIHTSAHRWANVNRLLFGIFSKEVGILTLAQHWSNIIQFLFALFPRKLAFIHWPNVGPMLTNQYKLYFLYRREFVSFVIAFLKTCLFKLAVRWANVGPP